MEESEIEVEDGGSTKPTVELTDDQKKKIESNREKAKALRSKRIKEKPYERPPKSGSPTKSGASTSSHVIPPTQWDTYGGYLLDDNQLHHSYSGRTVEDEGGMSDLSGINNTINYDIFFDSVFRVLYLCS